MYLEKGHYAVIFTSLQKDVDQEYHDTFDELYLLAQEIPGFIGIESAREELGITISYWKDMASIEKWRADSKHMVAKQKAKEGWYKSFTTTIARIELSHTFEHQD